jgi:hypothetical protein
MSAQETPKPKRGMLVEDETVVAGADENGATTIRAKTVEGYAPESVQPTDKREKKADA